MKLKSACIIFLICYVILSCSVVVASDNINNSNYSYNIDKEEIIVNENDEHTEVINLENTQNGSSVDINDSIEIYVGKNKSTDGGNGSYENPYSTFDLACKNVHGENNATINIFNGVYDSDSLLKFNTSNLFINGINGNVIIKNNVFSLSSSSANFTFNNIIFNSKPFNGYANYGTYNNCTFIGPFNMAEDNRGFNHYNFKAINCVFKNFNQFSLFGSELYGSTFLYFENCIFINSQLERFVQIMSENKNITMNGVWFGNNKIADYTKNILIRLNSGSWGGRKDISITKYAIFSVSESYLGDNKYEIVGRLTWNGTDSSEGMENFPPMTVTLTSTTGEIQNATLVNGSFKLNYTSNSSENYILIILDYQKVVLNFNTINLQVNPIEMYYGDNQNITIKFNKSVTGFINITVNNKTYEKIEVSNKDCIIYTIKDILTEGKYPIQVVLYNNEKNIHGLGISELTVFKVKDYEFIPILPSDVKVGSNKISFELPYDATGNVTIFLGKNNFTIDFSNNTETLIDGFVEGNNLIKILYSGDNKYVNKSIERIIHAEKFEVNLDNNLIFKPPLGNGVGSFIFNSPIDVEGNLTVNVNGKSYTQTIVNGMVSINIDDFPSGSYEATIYYSGNSKFYPNMIKESFVIPKPILSAQDVSIQYTSIKMYMVKITRGGKPITGKTITFNINGEVKTVKTDNKGYASVKINLPPKLKAYTITAKYLDITIKNKITVKCIVVVKNLKVKKTAKKFKIKVTLKKVDNKYLKGKQISLKFNGKTYKAKTNKKGVAIFTIKHNVIKKLKVGKKYTYKVTYLKETSSKKITVKK